MEEYTELEAQVSGLPEDKLIRYLALKLAVASYPSGGPNSTYIEDRAAKYVKYINVGVMY